MSHLEGDVSTFESPDYGHALVVAPDTTQLERLPEPGLPEPTTDVEERFVIDDSGAALEVTTRFRRGAAASARHRFESDAKDHVANDYLNFYAKLYPNITQTAPIDTHADSNGVFRIEERYRIEPLFEDGERHISAWSIQNELERPRIVKRRMPLAVDHPVFVRHTLVIDWDIDSDLDVDAIKLEGDAVTFRRHGKRTPGTATIVYELKSRNGHVEASRVKEHLQLLDEIEHALGYSLWSGAETPTVVEGSGIGTSWLVGSLVVTTLGVGFVVLRGRRKRQWKRRLRTSGAGEVPANPIVVSSMADLPARLRDVACACGTRRPQRTDRPPSEIRLGDRVLQAVELECDGCRRRLTRYVHVGPT